jgi:hypothetical protein
MKETVMYPSRPRWLWRASLLTLALLGSAILAYAVTLDREGAPLPPTLCPSVDVTKAAATAAKGGDRVYEFKGTCSIPPGLVPVSVVAQASASLTGTGFRTAVEKITVTGPGIDGTILTKAEKCTEDPFVKGAQVCSGPRSISTTLPAIWWQEAPLLAARVPADQVYDQIGSGPPPPAPPGLSRQVKIVIPTPGQIFSQAGGQVLVEFAPAWPAEPPDKGVKMEWQRRTTRGGWVAHSAVSHAESYKLALGVPIPTYFPQPGDYRLRATARTDGWTGWREFHVADAVKIRHEVQNLAQWLQRQVRDPDAARLLIEVKTLETQLASQRGDVDAVVPRLNELKREARRIQFVSRPLITPRRASGVPAVGTSP